MKKVYGVDTAGKGIALVSLPDEFIWIPKEKTADASLIKFYEECYKINADAIYVEDVTYVRNQKVTLLLASVLAVVKLAFIRRGIPSYTVNNMTWKKTIINKGNASKDEIKAWALNDGAKPDLIQDLYDAYCIYKHGILIENEKQKRE